jgi:signal transduction histidine kinase/CheY-like chemotaxis protein
LIEDDPDYTMLMSMYINEACGETLKYLLENAVSLQAGLDLLGRQEYDIVLLDLMLPDSQGLDTLVKIRAKAPSLPVVVLTNLDQDDAGLEAIAHGAQDFLSKSKLDAGRLRHAIGFALARDRVFHQMEKLVDGLPDGMVIIDRSRMVRYANAAALNLFGHKWEQFVGRLFDYALTPDHAVELKLPGRSGDELAAEMRVAEIEWKGYPAWVATIRNVSELKKLEQVRAEVRERRHTDQLKDQLLGTVAHELRTPLSVVKAVVGTFRDNLIGPLTGEQSEMIAIADRNISRLTRLLNNFLDLTRLESRRARISRQALDPLELLQEVCSGVRMANRGRPIVFLFDFPKELPSVRVDSDMIAQVIGNLLDNALRYARARVTVHAAATADAVEVSVTDDGPGIPTEKIADLFDKFVQLDRPKGGDGYKGTGLGLAISREIITLNGGRIWADDAPGRGACFRFTLPLSSKSAASPLEEDSHAQAHA